MLQNKSWWLYILEIFSLESLRLSRGRPWMCTWAGICNDLWSSEHCWMQVSRHDIEKLYGPLTMSCLHCYKTGVPLCLVSPCRPSQGYYACTCYILTGSFTPLEIAAKTRCPVTITWKRYGLAWSCTLLAWPDPVLHVGKGSSWDMAIERPVTQAFN